MITTNHLVLDALAASDLEFHPVGSRYIGSNTKYSDYDFIYAQKGLYLNKDVEEELLSFGFVRVDSVQYGYGKDRELSAMFRYTSQGVAAIDIFVFEKKEAKERLKTFKKLKEMYENYSYADNPVAKLLSSLKGNGGAWSAFHQLVQSEREVPKES